MHDLRNSVERRYPMAAVRTQIGFMAMLTVGTEEGARVELYYEDRGAGRPVVLIHGLLQDCRSTRRRACCPISTPT
jgi:hypothetical protein